MANLSPTAYKYRGTRRRMAGEKKKRKGKRDRERKTDSFF
jgi:hypothetical protein